MNGKKFLANFLSIFIVFSCVQVPVFSASNQTSQLKNVTSAKKMSKSAKIAIGIGTSVAAIAVVGLSIFAFKKCSKKVENYPIAGVSSNFFYIPVKKDEDPLSGCEPPPGCTECPTYIPNNVAKSQKYVMI